MKNIDLSVITRTKRRPLFLERAKRSIMDAKIDNMEWIVIEDDDEISEHTLNLTKDFTLSTNIPHSVILGSNKGRTFAANLGFEHAKGTYIHIHDDDDTISENFYEATLNYLNNNKRFKGVGTPCSRIDEKLISNTIQFIKKRKHYPERTQLGLFDIAAVFSCPPISLVLSRDVISDIDGCNTKYNVCEDFDLILRFLLKADIGYCSSSSSNFHVRLSDKGSSCNSEITRNFEVEDMVFRNQLLREDIANNRIGLGWLLANAKASRRSEGIYHLLQQLFIRFRA